MTSQTIPKMQCDSQARTESVSLARHQTQATGPRISLPTHASVRAAPGLNLRWLAFTISAALTACTVGPDFHSPQMETPTTWHDNHTTSVAGIPSDAAALAPSSAETHGPLARTAGSHPASPNFPAASSATSVASAPNAPASPASTPYEQADPDPQWWRSFHDPVLDGLIDRAARQNLDLQQAVLRIEEARAQVQSAAAAGLPNVRATGSYTREQLGVKGFLEDSDVYSKVNALGAPNSPINTIAPGSGAAVEQGANSLLNQLTAPVNLWQAGFDASWELDLFGRVRRQVESADAQTQQAIENRNDALVSLEAEIAQTYLQLRGAQAMRAVTVDVINQQREIADLTRSQAQVGITSQVDVDSADAQLTTTQAQLPQFDQQIAQALNGLSYLLGNPPGTLDDLLDAPGAIPPVPPQVPVGVPSTLARRRPDIRAAEAQLHQATAEVGVAVAQFYPDISLTGQVGMRGTHARDLAHWSSLFYSFGPSISLPIFQGGSLVANLRLSKAQQQEAALGYRKAVLTALRDVDNALAVYRTDQLRRDALGRTVNAQQTTFDLSRDSYRKGIVSFINVLDAERQLGQAQLQYVQGTMQVSTDLVALYKALGGGWEADAGTTGSSGTMGSTSTMGSPSSTGSTDSAHASATLVDTQQNEKGPTGREDPTVGH